MVVIVLSDLLRNLESIWRTAKRDAATKTRKTAGWITPNPGLITIIVPRKPRMTASQRWIPTFSPRNIEAKIITKNGATKLMATASANGTNIKAETKQTGETMTIVPRMICSFKLSVFKIETPRRESKIMTPKKRPN